MIKLIQYIINHHCFIIHDDSCLLEKHVFQVNVLHFWGFYCQNMRHNKVSCLQSHQIFEHQQFYLTKHRSYGSVTCWGQSSESSLGFCCVGVSFTEVYRQTGELTDTEWVCVCELTQSEWSTRVYIQWSRRRWTKGTKQKRDMVTKTGRGIYSIRLMKLTKHQKTGWSIYIQTTHWHEPNETRSVITPGGVERSQTLLNHHFKTFSSA